MSYSHLLFKQFFSFIKYTAGSALVLAEAKTRVVYANTSTHFPFVSPASGGRKVQSRTVTLAARYKETATV